MDSGEDAYVYAKACGMLASSFVGPRLNRLFEARTLHDLWALAFGDEVPVVPETILAKRIEHEAEKRFVADYILLLKMFSAPEEILVALLRFFDYDNLKEISAELCYKTGAEPDIVDIGNYSMLKYKDMKDIAGITKGTPVSWYNEADPAKQVEMNERLDKQYIGELWTAVKALRAADREPVERLIKEEIVFHNILWAIRLRVYFSFTKEEIIPLLASTGKGRTRSDELAGRAVSILDYPIDAYERWSQWKYADLLNPHEEGVYWTIDPRWVQHAAQREMYKTALSLFHRHPFTPCVMVSFFKIKQYEFNCICTAAEALRLNAEKAAVREFAGVAE